jgi:hypothetical protein
MEEKGSAAPDLSLTVPDMAAAIDNWPEPMRIHKMKNCFIPDAYNECNRLIAPFVTGYIKRREFNVSLIEAFSITIPERAYIFLKFYMFLSRGSGNNKAKPLGLFHLIQGN